MILIFLYALSVGSYPRDILFSDEISTNGLSNLETIDSPIGETRSSVQEKELPSLFKEIIPLLSEIGDVAIAPAVEEEVADIPVEFIFFFRKAKGKSKLESISSMVKSSIRLTRSMRSRQNRLFRCYVTQ